MSTAVKKSLLERFIEALHTRASSPEHRYRPIGDDYKSYTSTVDFCLSLLPLAECSNSEISHRSWLEGRTRRPEKEIGNTPIEVHHCDEATLETSRFPKPEHI